MKSLTCCMMCTPPPDRSVPLVRYCSLPSRERYSVSRSTAPGLGRVRSASSLCVASSSGRLMVENGSRLATGQDRKGINQHFAGIKVLGPPVDSAYMVKLKSSALDSGRATLRARSWFSLHQKQ
jgi:hypothetical protein